MHEVVRFWRMLLSGLPNGAELSHIRENAELLASWPGRRKPGSRRGPGQSAGICPVRSGGRGSQTLKSRSSTVRFPMRSFADRGEHVKACARCRLNPSLTACAKVTEEWRQVAGHVFRRLRGGAHDHDLGRAQGRVTSCRTRDCCRGRKGGRGGWRDRKQRGQVWPSTLQASLLACLLR